MQYIRGKDISWFTEGCPYEIDEMLPYIQGLDALTMSEPNQDGFIDLFLISLN